MSLVPEDAGPGAGGEDAFGLRRLMVRVPMGVVLKRILSDCYRVYDLPSEMYVEMVEVRQRMEINECDLVLRVSHQDFDVTRPGQEFPDACGGGSPRYLPWDEEEGEGTRPVNCNGLAPNPWDLS